MAVLKRPEAKKAVLVSPAVREEMEALAVKIYQDREAAKAINETVKENQEKLLEMMGTAEVKEFNIKGQLAGTGKAVLKAQVIQAKNEIVNEKKLKTALGVRLWNKVCSSHLDRKKLDAFIASGEVDLNLVARSSTTVLNAPYVKVN